MTICRICRCEYVKWRMSQKVCRNPDCALAWVALEKLKVANRARREAKAKLKTRQDWLKEAQSVFNKFIRLRDHSLPCISCQRHLSGTYHAGHYRSVGAAPQLRFNEANVHAQCVQCNLHKSGNAIDYRIGLTNRIGEAEVRAIEVANDTKRWTIEDCKQIVATYRSKIKELTL